MGATQGLGGPKPRGETGAGEPRREVGKECVLAAEEMGDSCDVEPQPIVAIDIESWAVAVRPAGER